MPKVVHWAPDPHVNGNNIIFTPQAAIFNFPPPPAPPPPPPAPSQLAPPSRGQHPSQQASNGSLGPSKKPSAAPLPWHPMSNPNLSKSFLQSQSPLPHPAKVQRPNLSANGNPLRQTPPTATYVRLMHLSERQMPQNDNDITMLKVIERVFVPSYLKSHPGCIDNGRACKRQYMELMKFRHSKLVARVEKWRQHVEYKSEDPELTHERTDKNNLEKLSAGRWRIQQSRVRRRELTDRESLTDYVNGHVEAVNRGRLMCWPVLIPPTAMDDWDPADLVAIKEEPFKD
ncbi:MAG: hypothetical protein Q9166_003150 [cf. Caloplaca sp. 2 TL-2023]